MGNKINTDAIDERLIVARVRGNQVKQEIVAPPLTPLPATISETVSETVLESEIAEVATKDEPAITQTEPPKDEKGRKRKTQDYEALFIKESHITARLGKAVYIRKEFHDRILKIIQVIGDNEVSLFSYIDNIIAHHFDNFQDDIVRTYNRKNSNSIF
jgi:hypothetical protein